MLYEFLKFLKVENILDAVLIPILKDPIIFASFENLFNDATRGKSTKDDSML